jgi:hypothetical protein
MKIVHTYSGSRYMIDEEAKTFRRLRGQDANEVANDEQDNEYIDILYLKVGLPMEILWKLDGKEKIRTTTAVKEIQRID